MSDVGDVAVAVKSVSDLVEGILSRQDRDAPDNIYHEDTNKIQNSFADNDLDAQWICAYRLLSDVGHSITTGGSVGDTERQFRHNALICIAELKYLKTLIGRIDGQRAAK